MAASDTEQLAALIQRKHTCLLRLHRMGQRQLELIAGDQMTELLDVLTAKQSFLLELQRIEGSLDPFRGQTPELRVWRTAKEREKCAEQQAGCERLLAGILEQEKQAETELLRRRDVTATDLHGAHAAGRARGAYTTRQRPRAGQLDIHSEG